MPAPQLTLSANNQKAADLLAFEAVRKDVLDRLIAGDSVLEIAQKYRLSEKQVHEILDAAYEIRTEYLKSSAETLQMMIFEQHNEMYCAAKKMAFPPPKLVTKKQMVDGEEVIVEELVPMPIDLMWFREMRVSLIERQKILEKYIGANKEETHNFVLTFIEGSQMAEFVANLAHLADRTVYDRP
jgi:hypothetical protein